MSVQIIKIGNSRGIRIPKEYLQGYEESTKFDLKKVGNSLILTPKDSREMWVEQMKNAQPEEVPFFENDFDKEEWVWE